MMDKKIRLYTSIYALWTLLKSKQIELFLAIGIFIFTFSPALHASPADSIAHLQEYEIVPYTDRLAQHIYKNNETIVATNMFNTWQQQAQKQNDLTSQIAAYAFLGRYYKFTNEVKPAIENYQLALKLAAGNYQYIEPVLRHELGDLYYKNDQNALGLENLIKANTLMERIGYRFFPETSEYLYELGYAYAYYYEDFAMAELYVKKALTFPITNPQVETMSHNMLGLICRAVGKPTASMMEFRMALQKAVVQKDSALIGEISGNIGYNYYMDGQLDSATILMQKDYQYSYQHQNWTSACLTKLVLAKIAYKRNELTTAKKYIDDATMLAEQKKAFITKKASYIIYTSLYQNIVQLQKSLGNDKATITAQDSLLFYSNQLLYTKDAKEQAAVQIKLITENNDYQLMLVKSEETRKTLLRNTLILLCLSVAVIFALIARQQKQKAKNTENQLHDYTNRMVENNQLLEQFKTELEQLKSQPEKIEIEIEEVFTKLRTRTLLTEDDRQIFKTDFERIYKNFFANIKEQISDITPAEMRLLALTKLNLSTKEMADLQGISPDSIIKARYRLKKKIELKAKENSDLSIILKNVS